jgi:hypothetical protein
MARFRCTPPVRAAREAVYAIAWMRLIMSWYFGPYLSHTGLTAF